MIKITLPDGKFKEIQPAMTIADFVITHIGEGLAKAALAASVDGTTVDVMTTLDKSCSLAIYTNKNPQGMQTLWHSTSHVLAIATLKRFPKAKLTIGPSTEDGFYYDFDVEKPFTPEDLEAIEKDMHEICKQDLPFERHVITYAQAKKTFAKNPYKLELIEEYKDSELTTYSTGDFVDLCKGPHIPSTGKIKACKLLRSSGVYWRADAKNAQLQRIYGISFTTTDELKKYMTRLEEAKARDHRKLAKEHNLVMFHEYAPGMPFFMTKGAAIYNQLIEFIRNEYRLRGYQEVITPQLFNKKLWETSGHWQHYKDDMFVLKMDEQEASLKPMNCPSHCLMYLNSAKSYRDLPWRVADFCSLHRNELTGALSGMTRVRKFSQDDAHIFCTMDQIESEVLGVLQFIKYVWEEIFGFKLTYYLSTKPEKSLGTKEQWAIAEDMLAKALQKAQITYTIKPGDGAFYGPKIDIDMEDALGRKWQCPTCQLDFNLPSRFGLTYEGSDGKQHTPVMVHRAVLGSIERCMAMLIEQYAAKFPLWLSPVQVRVLSIADRHNDYANSVVQKLKISGIRAEVDERSLTTPNKVRQAQIDQVNYILVVGDSEVKNSTVNVRTRDNAVLGEQALDVFSTTVLEQIRSFK